MLIRAEPASRLPCAAPAASSPGHSAGRSGRTAPGGRTSALRGSVASGRGSPEGERRIPRGRHPEGQSDDRARWAAVCPCGCAPSRRCSRGRRPRAPLSSRGPHSPVPPVTASTPPDGVRGCARGHTSKRGAGPRREPEGGPRVARRHSHLPGPARRRRDMGTPATDGAVPPTRFFARVGAPPSRRLRGWRRTSQPRGPGAETGILAVPVETFPAK
jgi:hypothetical protein